MVSLKLVKPSAEMEKEYLAYISEWEASGEAIVPLASSRDGRGYPGLLEIWEENATEKAYEKGWVPSTLYFLADEDGKIYGASHIRHELNGYLFRVGGHVGYGIRPSERGKGYASKMLGLTLPLAKQLGINRLLVTCDRNNAASAKTIRKNGGLLENEVPYEGETVQRYWIEIAGPGDAGGSGNTDNPGQYRTLRSKKVVLFDLDGTLTDPKAGITKSVAYALDSFGIKTDDPDGLCCYIGPPLKESFMKFHAFSGEGAVQAIAKYREYFSVTGIYENCVYQGVENLLRRLAEEGRRLVVATSKPKIFADRILEHFDIARYFSLVCGSELDGTRSKKEEVIEYALKEAGVTDREEAVMVGDREHDAIGAREAGIDCIGVLYGYGTREELENAGAARIAGSVEELGEILG